MHSSHFLIGDIVERFHSEGPDLIEQAPIAPHITGRGVLSIVYGFRGCPFDRNFASMRNIVVFI
jgi:hypothetical protein